MKHKELKQLITEMGLTDFQTETIVRNVINLLDLNDHTNNTYPDSCPNCGTIDTKFIKKGVNTGKQRYQCKSCFSVFVWDVNRLTYHSKVHIDKWNIVIRDTLSIVPLLETAANTDLTERTVFRMRHKFLLLLETMIQDNLLVGVIECDETYVQESNKGKKIPGKKARKRQASASKRGLSSEQICVIVATNRQGIEYACVVDSGKPSASAIRENLEHHIQKDSVMITDALASYNNIVALKAFTHYTLSSHKDYNNLLHLNTVNSIHSIFKSMIRQYRGVATKYLNRYCALLVFVRKYAQMDDNEMMLLMRQQINKSSIFCKSKLLATTNLVLV